MKRFKNFISEETMPYAGTSSGTIDVRDTDARDNINRILSGITHGRFVTPYIAFERVSKALANFLIFPPRQGFLEGDSGEVHFEIKQFGEKMGMNDDGTVISAPALPYYIYFEYRLDDNGMFNIFCEVVDQDDLEEIFDDLEDEMNDEDDEDSLDEATLAGPETGSRKVPGSNQTDMGGDDTCMSDSIKRKVRLKLAESSWGKLTKYQQGARVTRDMTSSLGKKIKLQKGIDLAQAKKWGRAKVSATLPDEEDETDKNKK